MFKEEAKLMFLLPVALVAIGLLAGYVGPRIIGSGCSNTVIDEMHSPNKKNKFVVFTRDCGATTAYSTQVSLLKAQKTLKNKSGNIFISDSNYGKCPSLKGGGPIIKVKWDSNELLILEHHENARVFKSENQFKNIRIKYNKYQ